MNRRQFVAASAAPAVVKGRRPNVLFVISDQWSPLASDLSGSRPMPRTPAADSIAASGARFDSAYCTWPLCSPSRSSLFTGRMPHETRITGNVSRGASVPESIPTLGELFARAGYATGFFGKEHTGGAAWRGFQELGTYQYPGAGYLADGCGADPIFARDAIRFIEANRSRPFLAVLSLINPHDICFTPARARIPEKSYVDVNMVLRKGGKFLRNLDFPAPRPNLEALPPAGLARVSKVHEPWTEEDWRLYLATYYLLIENTDWLIGLTLDALKRAGLERDTIVLFTADHGDQMGAHRLVGKNVFYEECMRVPFAVSWPGQVQGGLVNRGALVSETDALPTLCDLAGVAPPAGIPGRSVRPLLDGGGKWRDHLVAELNDGRMLRTATHKYVAYRRQEPAQFLYELSADPLETRDLSAVPSARPQLERCRALLEDWMRESGGAWDQTSRPPGRG